MIMAFCKMGHPWSILCPPFCTYRSGWFVPRHMIRISLHSFSLNFERNSRDDEMTCYSKILICAKLASGLLTMFLLRDNSLLFKCFISKFEIFLMTIFQLSDSILLSEGFSTVQTGIQYSSNQGINHSQLFVDWHCQQRFPKLQRS